jgi:tRNA G18 (ribose-2'-O)-methylase SpoU
VPRLSLHIPDDPRLDVYRNLTDRELLRTGGVFIAEGRLVVRRLLDGGRFAVQSLLLSPAAAADAADLLHAHPDVPAFVLPASQLDATAGFHVHRGCLAAAERGAPLGWRDVALAPGPVVVLEGIADPDNVGSIFRHAAAFGAAGVLLGPSTVDPLYRKAIRTSMGATLRVPFAKLDGWPDCLAALRDAGRTVVALTLSPGSLPLRRVARDLRGTHLALLLGHEGGGLSAAAEALAAVRVRIPMAPGADSLNVAAAAAIALYELSQPGE